ncbi:hypothetical protein RhiXN_03516 [Rhizoctonia solani]|uniref:Uncharacterized protein n=1 Tax=Rhizoctonia solani TaxID=456999 RepID=A0A8H8NTS0_9AGAM|nr:uncharacterized protein RhiXN_03516 [Rhizoctonia solani]QRW18592.1 hypothetical protein RhiXN_03516 [Rhizoctonia solani]
MPMTSTSNKNATELAAANVQKATLIGTFTVFLSQTHNHPDQQALDQSWVDTLVERIGTPEILNQALHPISVILNDGSSDHVLYDLLQKHGINSTPELPQDLTVLVFAGQHCLAMLSQLGLGGPEDMWWHAKVYKKELEQNHPAEFLTMMHESNSPQLMKHSSDLELFLAVWKLRKLLKSGTINEEKFLQNCCMLLGGLEDRTNWAICNLTRNHELMDAILDSLARVHIAATFSAGSWMRLTTGRLYMVAAGLVHEMLAQVDLLTEGMSDVPKDALTLPPRSCQMSKLKVTKGGQKRQAHAWDALPGGRSGALKRVRTRPTNFVTHLNPRKDDPWTFPDMVILPSCLGSKIVEEELKLMQTVTTHMINMITTKDEFTLFTKGTSETIENTTDHPAGVIAQFLLKKHGDEANARGYECKVMQRVWSSWETLHTDLQKHKMLELEDASQEKYQQLLNSSKAWWTVMRLFKVKRLHTKFELLVPKEFGDCQESGTLGVSSQKQQRLRANKTPGVIAVRQDTFEANLQESDVDDMEDSSYHEQSNHGHTTMPSLEDHSGDQGQVTGSHGGYDQIEDVEVDHDIEGVHTHQDGSEDGGDNEADAKLQQGGDWELDKSILRVIASAESMTKEESRGLAELLDQITASHRDGDMQYLVDALLAKGKHVSTKLKKVHEHEYNSVSEDEDRGDGQGSAVEEEEREEGHMEEA